MALDAETKEKIFLLPGDLAFSTRPLTISTLLGSCVAVCLFDKKNGWGGMNHIMLPSKGERTAGFEDLNRYAGPAIENLLAKATLAGSKLPDLVASVYGGGNVYGHDGTPMGISKRGSEAKESIGGQNVAKVLGLLAEKGVKVVRRETGGQSGMKVHMHLPSGEIEKRLITQSQYSRERAAKTAQFKKRAIKVLVVDDSPTVCAVLKAVVQTAPDMVVVGQAHDAYEARELILEHEPDLISLDLMMPRMHGVTFLKKLMRYKFIPVVVVSTIAQRGSAMRMKAFSAGAADVIDKNELNLHSGIEEVARKLLPKFRAAATTAKPLALKMPERVRESRRE